MDISWLALVRALHITAAAVWFGGVAIGSVLIGPAVREAGPAGGAFMGAVQKRGGFARVMGPAAGVTILAGAILYGQYGYHRAPFSTLSSTLLTLGALSAIAAWLGGFVLMLPIQRRMGAAAPQPGTPPTTEQAATMERLGKRLTRNGQVVAALVTASFVLMVGRNIVV